MRLRHRAHVAGIESKPTKTGFSMRKRAWYSLWPEPRVVGHFVVEPGGTRIDVTLRYAGFSLGYELYGEALWLSIPSLFIVAGVAQLASGGDPNMSLLAIVMASGFIGLELIL